jgi:hypothetical protein
MKKPIRIRGMKPGSIRFRSAKSTSIRFRDVLKMEGTTIWRDTGDKYANYSRGIMRIYGSYPEGPALCSAMASEWAKEVDRLKNEYHAFKEKYPQLAPDEKRNAWRCFAHAHKGYRRGWPPLGIIESELALMKCPPSLIEKIIEYFRGKKQSE